MFQTVDENFNRAARKFTNLDNAVRILVRDISANLEQMVDSISGQETVANDIADFYMDRATSEVDNFCKVHNHIAEKTFQEAVS